MSASPPLFDGAPRPAGGARLESPSFARNAEPIRTALAALAPLAGAALEIGCGPGRHAADLAASFPDLTILPTDPDPACRASADAWGEGLANVLPARALDAADDWGPFVADLAPFALVYAINVAHIAPWPAVVGLIAGAGRVLAPGGRLAFYGAFIEAEAPLTDGNRAFDAMLRARDPAMGLRDLGAIGALAEGAGLVGPEIARLPADNLLVSWRRGAVART